MAEAREVALEILVRCDTERVPSDPLLGPMIARSGLDERDRRLATTLVQTTHRWRGRADRVLDRRLARGLRSLDPRTLNALRLAYVQLFHLDQIPPHAAVHTTVDLVWRHAGEGKSRLANKVLRGLLGRPPQPEEWGAGRGAEALAGELSHPAWLLDRWLRRWGEERTRAICRWNNSPPDLHLRVSGGAKDAPRVMRALAADGISVSPGALLPEALRARGTFDVRRHALLRDGALSVQDESQMLVGNLWPDPRAGPVLDLCAAPGTKTAHLVELSPGVEIVAADADARRIRRVAAAMRRLRQSRVRLLVADGRALPCAAVFRRVLLDAPCTSLGVLRRRPDARWLRAPGDVANAARLQRALLEAAAGALLPGGWLLYSVCTLEPEETDLQIAGFLKMHPEFAPEPVGDWIPAELRAPPGGVRILPGTMGMEGLYAVLLVKQASGRVAPSGDAHPPADEARPTADADHPPATHPGGAAEEDRREEA